MRLGIFSDVHANLEALRAVIEAYKTESIDRYYCLGDVVGYGASPDECSDIVRGLVQDTILGNHDAAVSGRMDYSYYYEAARKVLDAHASWLSADNMQWLKSLPYKLELPAFNLLLTHGSPACPGSGTSRRTPYTGCRPSRRRTSCPGGRTCACGRSRRPRCGAARRRAR